jgi:hypothetical protein
MDKIKNVPFMITIPREYRDLLRRIAAEKTLMNPDEVTSAAQLGKEIIITHLELMKQENSEHENRGI